MTSDAADDAISLSSVVPVIDSSETSVTDQFIAASQRGDVELLTELLPQIKEESGDEFGKLTDKDGVSPIHWASLNNRIDAVDFLIDSKFDADISGGDLGATPILWASRYGLVYIVNKLIKKAHVKTDTLDSTRVGILHAAVFSSNVMMVTYVLNMIDGIDIDFQDMSGRSALHWAAYQGDHLSVEVLLNEGAKVDLQDENGFTALHWALVNGNSRTIQLLLKFGTDINIATSDGKTCWTVASDMNFTNNWCDILRMCKRNPSTGDKMKFHFTENQAKVIIFFIPHFDLPFFNWLLLGGQSLFIQLFLLFAVLLSQILILKKMLLPVITTNKNGLLKSPLFAGLFSSSVVCVLLTEILVFLPKTFGDKFFAHLSFLFLSSACYFLFFKTMNTDPGYIVNEGDKSIIRGHINDLVDVTKYDEEHFCIHTLIRKPIRSHYSYDKRMNVARFDHYCPWVYNDIGIRNHKLFFAFILSMFLSIICWLDIALEYFDELDDDANGSCYLIGEDLCSGLWSSPLSFGIFIWVALQLIWLTFLLIVQTFQISKGNTTFEFSKVNSINSTDAQTAGSDERRGFLKSFLKSRFAKMVGLDQFFMVTEDTLIHPRSISSQFNYGFKQNWIDFLFLRKDGDSCNLRTLMDIPVNMEGNLNGAYVDYKTLYNIPELV